MAIEDKEQELAELQARVQQLQGEIAEEASVEAFRPSGYYTAYFATAGFVLGMFGALASLLFNVVGSLMVGQDALQLIKVYLTFPLGDRALDFTPQDNGLVLAVGFVLYIGTGMLLGVPFYLALTRWTPNSSFGVRLALVSVLSIAVWLFNFYVILSWLQPLVVPNMSPENYIVNQVPPWVAALTHLVFGWTMVVVYPLGQFVPYKRITEQ